MNNKYLLQVDLQRHYQCLQKLEKILTTMLLCSAPSLTTDAWMKLPKKENISLLLEEDFWVQNLPVLWDTKVGIVTYLILLY